MINKDDLKDKIHELRFFIDYCNKINCRKNPNQIKFIIYILRKEYGYTYARISYICELSQSQCRNHYKKLSVLFDKFKEIKK